MNKYWHWFIAGNLFPLLLSGGLAAAATRPAPAQDSAASSPAPIERELAIPVAGGTLPA